MRPTRRTACLMLAAATLPCRLAAEEAPICVQLSNWLMLCPDETWAIESVETDGAVVLAHRDGLRGSVRLRQNLDAEALAGARHMISHAPISARAQVLETEFFKLAGTFATTVVYHPRHAKPALIVVQSAVIGGDYTLEVYSHESGTETYGDQHRTGHAALLAAFRTDEWR